LKEDAGVQLEIDLPGERFGEATAMAIYQLMAAVVDTSEIESHDRISISGRNVEGRLIVDVVLEEPLAATELTHAVDRIGALGGTVVFTEAGVHAEMPCG
jgi:hypothetical protein